MLPGFIAGCKLRGVIIIIIVIMDVYFFKDRNFIQFYSVSN